MELIITLTIAAGLLAMGIITMTGYLPKQYLTEAVDTLENLLSRAQFEANARSVWTCLKVSGTPTAGLSLQVFADVNKNHMTGTTGCGDGTDYLITQQSFRNSIVFVSTGCSAWGFPRPIWFDTSQIPHDCTGGDCAPTTFEIPVKSTKIPQNGSQPFNLQNSREVEVLSSGLIGTVPKGEAGFRNTIKIPEASSSTTTSISSCTNAIP